MALARVFFSFFFPLVGFKGDCPYLVGLQEVAFRVPCLTWNFLGPGHMFALNSLCVFVVVFFK